MAAPDSLNVVGRALFHETTPSLPRRDPVRREDLGALAGATMTEFVELLGKTSGSGRFSTTSKNQISFLQSTAHPHVYLNPALSSLFLSGTAAASIFPPSMSGCTACSIVSRSPSPSLSPPLNDAAQSAYVMEERCVPLEEMEVEELADIHEDFSLAVAVNAVSPMAISPDNSLSQESLKPAEPSMVNVDYGLMTTEDSACLDSTQCVQQELSNVTLAVSTIQRDCELGNKSEEIEVIGQTETEQTCCESVVAGNFCAVMLEDSLMMSKGAEENNQSATEQARCVSASVEQEVSAELEHNQEVEREDCKKSENEKLENKGVQFMDYEECTMTTNKVTGVAEEEAKIEEDEEQDRKFKDVVMNEASEEVRAIETGDNPMKGVVTAQEDEVVKEEELKKANENSNEVVDYDEKGMRMDRVLHEKHSDGERRKEEKIETRAIVDIIHSEHQPPAANVSPKNEYNLRERVNHSLKYDKAELSYHLKKLPRCAHLSKVRNRKHRSPNTSFSSCFGASFEDIKYRAANSKLEIPLVKVPTPSQFEIPGRLHSMQLTLKKTPSPTKTQGSPSTVCNNCSHDSSLSFSTSVSSPSSLSSTSYSSSSSSLSASPNSSSNITTSLMPSSSSLSSILSSSFRGSATEHGHTSDGVKTRARSLSSQSESSRNNRLSGKCRATGKSLSLSPNSRSPRKRRVSRQTERQSKEKSQKTCALCGLPSNSRNLGYLFGPYNYATSSPASSAGSYSPHDIGDTEDVMMHVDCAVWTPGVCLVGTELKGLQESVQEGSKVQCVVCGCFGATLSCHRHGCKSAYHYPCARDNSCQFVKEQYSIYCEKHKKEENNA